ncbi:MAG: hypothetical protein K0R63_1737 [Rickettsiales bacterium]|jgi:hypothetical protein|nr:hypothetical protein [Rickettsiales bacterium]
MQDDFINYGELIDDAMHIIVKRALEIVREQGLPGDHHFFISFLTHYPGVQMSRSLKDKYPEEMTIVLQYQFENLIVTDEGFGITLSFDNIKERLEVPFAALTAFADPSVKFGLQFRHIEEDEAEGEEIPVAEVRDFVSPDAGAVVGSQAHTGKKPSAGDNIIALDAFRKKKK